MLKKFKNNILANFFTVVILTLVIIYTFFKIALHHITKHNETVAVPELRGKNIEEAKSILRGKKLNYKIMEKQGYSSAYPPHTILEQHPAPTSKVKPFRNIYIKLNSENPPNTQCPNLLNASVKNAQIVLKNHNLLVGETTYVPDIAQNAVIKQLYNGKKIAPGTPIPQGSKIDLVIGAGLSNEKIKVPDLLNKNIEEAKFILINAKLKPGIVSKEPTDAAPIDTIIKQIPLANQYAKVGEMIDLWVVAAPSEEPNFEKQQEQQNE
jgi:beta-lactam-binding protein with PASTA domain